MSNIQNRLTGELSSLIWHTERIILREAGCANDIGEVDWNKAKALENNPFADKSKCSTLAIYKILSLSTIRVFRTKTGDNSWHWFLIDNMRYERYLQAQGKRAVDFIFCPTKRQFKLAWKESPTDVIKKMPLGQEFDTCEEIKSPTSPDHYDQESQQFEKKLMTSKKNWREHLLQNPSAYIP